MFPVYFPAEGGVYRTKMTLLGAPVFNT